MKPKFEAKLDKQFMPLSLVCKQMREETKENGPVPMGLACASSPLPLGMIAATKLYINSVFALPTVT